MIRLDALVIIDVSLNDPIPQPFLSLFPLLLCTDMLFGAKSRASHISHRHGKCSLQLSLPFPVFSSHFRSGPLSWERSPWGRRRTKQNIPQEIPVTNQSLIPSKFILRKRWPFRVTYGAWLNQEAELKGQHPAETTTSSWLPDAPPLLLSGLYALAPPWGLHNYGRIAHNQLEEWLLTQVWALWLPPSITKRSQQVQLWDDFLAGSAELMKLVTVWLGQQSYPMPLNRSLGREGDTYKFNYVEGNVNKLGRPEALLIRKQNWVRVGVHTSPLFLPFLLFCSLLFCLQPDFLFFNYYWCIYICLYEVYIFIGMHIYSYKT